MKLSSLRDTFLPKIWGKNVQGVKKHHEVLHVDTTLLFWNHHLGTLFYPKFGGKNVQNLGEKMYKVSKNIPKIWGKKCPKFGGKNVQGHIGTKFYYIETKSWARVISICRFVINLFLFFHAMAMKNITFRQKVETFFSGLKL